MMHLIVYVSSYTGPSDGVNSVLDEIVIAAKKNNPKFEITGVLFYHDGVFMQVIEGTKENLEGLMNILEKDVHHKNIERLIDEPIIFRSFSDWNMDSFNLSDKDTLNHDKLREISNVYKESFTMNTEVLTSFYKAMVNTAALKSILPN